MICQPIVPMQSLLAQFLGITILSPLTNFELFYSKLTFVKI